MDQAAPRFAADQVPERMRYLPLDHRGFPVPWFVAWLDGDGKLANAGEPDVTPDFRVVDTRKFVRAVRERRCWLCGRPLGRFLAFVIGPMCAINRVNSEPPSHRECAEFGLRACPFLSRPRMRRNEVDLPVGMIPAAGVHLEHNPGAMCLWMTTSYRLIEPTHGQPGVLLELGEPTDLVWFAEGRLALRDEVEASIAKGLPQLTAVAELQGGDSVVALAEQIDRFRQLTGFRVAA
jgi:hypothetical protein